MTMKTSLKNAVGTTAESFYNFCKAQHATTKMLEAIKGLPAFEFWESTDRTEFMLWLLRVNDYQLTRDQMVVYNYFKDSAQKEYKSTTAAVTRDAEVAAMKEYNRTMATVLREVIGNPFI